MPVCLYSVISATLTLWFFKSTIQHFTNNLDLFWLFLLPSRYYQPSRLLDYEWSIVADASFFHPVLPRLVDPILPFGNSSTLAQLLTHHHRPRRSSLQLTFPSTSRSRAVTRSLVICEDQLSSKGPRPLLPFLYPASSGVSDIRPR